MPSTSEEITMPDERLKALIDLRLAIGMLQETLIEIETCLRELQKAEMDSLEAIECQKSH